jgi:CheY-like chemotaxis protein
MTTILVVEDEATLCMNIVQVLKFENYEVVGADNRQAGLRLARELLPDLIICDIAMPVLDGFAVITELRQDPTLCEIPLIFLTARADPAAAQKGTALGANAYITKPFSLPDLLEKVRQLLSS